MDRVIVAIVTAVLTASVVGFVVWRAVGGVEERVKHEQAEHAAQLALCKLANPRPAPCTMVEVGWTWTGQQKNKRCDAPTKGCGG